MIQRRAPLKRGGPIRRQSKKRAKQNREYLLRNELFLQKHRICQIWVRENGWMEVESLPSNLYSREDDPHSYTWESMVMHFNAPESSEVHHTNKRNGDRLNDEAFWAAVGRTNHTRVHDNPGWARENGWLK